MLIKGKKIILVLKILVAIEKIAFGNIEHWHGDERFRFCVGKDYQ